MDSRTDLDQDVRGPRSQDYDVLLGILNLAVRDRRLPANPAAGVALPWVVEKPRRYLTAVQVETLAAAAGPGREPVFILSYSGLRWSELAALRVGRVDLCKRRLEIAEAMTEVDRNPHLWRAQDP